MEERTSDATPPANITHADWQATPLPVRQLVGRLLDLARQALTDAWNAGMWHLEREHYDGAHVSLTRALDTARTLGDQALEVWLLAHLSQVEVGRGHVAPAEEKARKALEVAGAVGDDKLRALALNSLGVALLHGGKSGVPAAVDHLRRAVDLARASRGPVLPEAMINLANALLHRGNLTEAAEWLDQVETGASDQISEELRVLCQINRATLAGLRGERWEAERHARAAVQECAGREDRTHWMALVTLALCLVELGDELEARGKGDPQGTFKDAETNFVAAAELAGRLHHRQGVWVARLNQAMLLSRMARYEEARQMILEQVLPLVVEHRDHRSEAFCHLNLGDIHLAALARQVGLDPQ
ncbi:MAG: hypothetical protein N2378_17195, partial [Chloroflexaceae bacterium]|nr:hypothetical protein [Chloroflexaceae bacterium]